jgi:small subunit ribosomal protein S2
MIERDITRLMIRLSGVRNMKKLPDLLFIVDVNREETAVHEANLKDIPILAMVDTNCNPTNIDYVIPSNDDAIRAIKLMVAKIADAVIEGKLSRKDDMNEDGSMGDLGDEKLVVRPRMDEDYELDDETLLGASTLAKLEPEKEVVVEEVIVTEKEAVVTEPEAVVEELIEVDVVNEDLDEAAPVEVIDEVDDDFEEDETEKIVKKPKAKKKTSG